MPSALTYPGVYVEEIPSGVRTIAGVSTSVAAFVDYFRRGLVNKATRVFNFGDFEREFGGLDRSSECSYALQQFFLNGGTEAWIVRCVGGTGAAAGATLLAGINGATSLTLEAGRATRGNPGSWGQQLRVLVTPQAPLSGNRFNLAILLMGTRNGQEFVDTSEEFRDLSVTPTDPRFVRTVINDEATGSKLVRLTQAPGATPPLATGTLTASFPAAFPGITSAVPQVLVTIGADTGLVRLSAKPTSLVQARGLLEAALRLARPERAAFADATVQVIDNRLRILAGPSSPATQITFGSGGTDPVASNLGLLNGDSRDGRQSGNLASFTQPATDLTISVVIGSATAATVTLLRTAMADLAGARTELETKVRAATTVPAASPLFTQARVVLVADGTERRLVLLAGAAGAGVTVGGAGAAALLMDPANSTATARHFFGEQRLGRQSANVGGGALPLPPAANPVLTITMGTAPPVNVTLIAANMTTLPLARAEFETKVRAANAAAAFAQARVVLSTDGADSRLILLAGAAGTTVTVTGTATGLPSLLMDAGTAAASNVTAFVSAQLTPPLNAPVGARLGAFVGNDGSSLVRLPATANTLATVAAQLQAGIRLSAPLATTRVIPYESAGQSRFVVLAGTAGNLVSFASAPDVTTMAELRLTSAAGATANVQAYAFGAGAALAGTAQGIGTVGTDVLPDANALIGDLTAKTGMRALEDADLFNLLCIPRASTLAGDAATATAGQAVLASALTYCERRRAFLLMDTPTGRDEPEEISQWLEENASLRHRNAALFYPRVKIPDPLDEFRLRSFGASGTVAGLFARIDSTRGVWKAPAGTEAVVRNVPELEDLLTDQENGALNPRAINCLRNFPIYGNVVWGARTLDGSDQAASEWKYIPVRRMALFLEESLFRGLKWVVFEPNDEPLWAQIRLNAGAFMNNLFRQGAFQGSTPRDAYFVKCDKETTTQNDINLGIVNIVVGFAPLKPAEFVVIKLQQMAGQIAT